MNKGDIYQLPIPRRNLYFGKIDAKNSVSTRDSNARDLFFRGFVKPSREDLDSIISGNRYIIYGRKGSGKTALLRYLYETEKKSRNNVKFIVFSEDISESDRRNITKTAVTASKTDEREVNEESYLVPDFDDSEVVDVKDAWSIFLLSKVFDLVADSQIYIDDNALFRKVKAILDDALGGGGKDILSRILSRVKSGTLAFSIKASSVELSSVLEFEPDNKTPQSINYTRLIEVAKRALKLIQFPVDVKFCIYIDEINLSVMSRKLHKRDSILIRDIIRAVSQFNHLFIEMELPIYLYAGVRSEVARIAFISRVEIDKILTDNGYKFDWCSGHHVANYKIFSVIENRINAIESSLAGKVSRTDEVWSRYFSRDIYGVTPKMFISEITWCNPRDIVMLFNCASNSEASLRGIAYSTSVFSGILQQYSEEVWEDRVEELNASHAAPAVQNFKAILNTWDRHFNIDTMEKRLRYLAGRYVNVPMFRTPNIAESICRDLYHAGIVSMGTPRRRGQQIESIEETWFHRDGEQFRADSWYNVHKALWMVLNLRKPNEDVFGKDTRILE